MADEGHTLATAPYYRLLRTLSGEHVLGGERSRSTLGRASVGAWRTGREALGGGGGPWRGGGGAISVRRTVLQTQYARAMGVRMQTRE